MNIGTPGPVFGHAPDHPSQPRAQQPADEQRQYDQPDLNCVVERQHVGVEPGFQACLEFLRTQTLGNFIHGVCPFS